MLEVDLARENVFEKKCHCWLFCPVKKTSLPSPFCHRSEWVMAKLLEFQHFRFCWQRVWAIFYDRSITLQSVLLVSILTKRNFDRSRYSRGHLCVISKVVIVEKSTVRRTYCSLLSFIMIDVLLWHGVVNFKPLNLLRHVYTHL